MNGLQNTAVPVKPVAVPGLLGNGLKGAVSVSSPETGVRMVLDACRAGRHEQAAGYFQGGAVAYRMAPVHFTDFLNVLTDDQAAVAFTVDETEYCDRLAVLIVSTFADPERSRRQHTHAWCFLRSGLGWAVLGVS